MISYFNESYKSLLHNINIIILSHIRDALRHDNAYGLTTVTSNTFIIVYDKILLLIYYLPKAMIVLLFIKKIS